MKTLISIISGFALTIITGLAGEPSFIQLADRLMSHRLKVAESYIEEKEHEELLIPNIRKDYFQLDESEKNKFLLFWISWTDTEAIDGENALLLTMLFGANSEKWVYDKELAKKRYERLQGLGIEKREKFVKSLGLSVEAMEENLVIVARILEL